MKRHITFIINPKAGTTRKDSVQDTIAEMMDSDKFEWHIETTQYAGHAIQIAADSAARGDVAAVAVDGDGTVNEVARALVHSDTALGIIPMGSGNGLARHLQIPVEVDNAIRVINDCIIKPVDYGVVGDIPFFCTCGVGFDANVSDKFACAGRRGMLTYAETMISEGLHYEADDYEVEIDGRQMRFKAFLITCANASQYGNNVYIAPEAHVTDGLLDVTIMEPFKLAESADVVYRLLNHTILKRGGVHSFKCRSIKIKRKKDGVIHYDGDPTMAPAILNIEIVPKGLKAIISSYERYSGGPLRSALSDIYEGTLSEVRQNNRRIMRINKELLGRLRGEIQE